MWKTVRRFLIFCFFCFLGVSQLSADTVKIYKFGENQNKNSTISRKLTLVDILDIALKNNPQVRQSWINVDISGYDYKMAKAAWFPEIEASLNYAFGESNYDDDIRADTKINNLDPALSLSYLLFDFGGREADIASFNYKLISTKYDTNSFVQNFLYSVVEAYYNLFSSIANLETAIETEKASGEAFNAADTRYRIGVAPLTDKLQAENSFIQDRLTRERAEREVKLMKGNLNYLLNLDPSTELDLSPPKLDMKDDLIQKSVGKLMKVALNNRPDLQSKYQLKMAQKKNIYSAQTSRLPSIRLNGSVGMVEDYVRDVNNDRDHYNVGINASMPIFTGGYLYNNVAKTKAELQSINAQIDDLEKNIENDVWTAYNNFQTAKDIHETSITLLANALETEKTVLGMYKNGKASILDVLTAQTSLSQARYEFNSSLYNYFINRADLARSVGKINSQDFETLTNVVNL